MACETGHTGCARVMLNAGYSPNSSSREDGMIPVHLAARNGHTAYALITKSRHSLLTTPPFPASSSIQVPQTSPGQWRQPKLPGPRGTVPSLPGPLRGKDGLHQPTAGLRQLSTDSYQGQQLSPTPVPPIVQVPT